MPECPLSAGCWLAPIIRQVGRLCWFGAGPATAPTTEASSDELVSLGRHSGGLLRRPILPLTRPKAEAQPFRCAMDEQQQPGGAPAHCRWAARAITLARDASLLLVVQTSDGGVTGQLRGRRNLVGVGRTRAPAVPHVGSPACRSSGPVRVDCGCVAGRPGSRRGGRSADPGARPTDRDTARAGLIRDRNPGYGWRTRTRPGTAFRCGKDEARCQHCLCSTR
jgi:hypothetical protein